MRAVRLVERCSVERRIPRVDVAALAADWSHAVEVTPTSIRGHYRVAARGWAGTFATPNLTWQITPKLGWAAVGRMIDGGWHGDADDLGTGLRSALATRLAVLLRERLAAGLARGYADSLECAAVVRGRIDFAARQPTHGFAQVVDDFTFDQPWNGWPLGIAKSLLDYALEPSARESLKVAAEGYIGVRPRVQPPTTSQLADPRLADYKPLLAWCEVVDNALSGGGLLFNLERLFESYLSDRFDRPCRGRTVLSQHELTLRCRDGSSGLRLRPDLVVHDSTGRPVSVWDVKWKELSASGPRPDDLHQALGYAAALGVPAAGLLYPGRRYSRRRYVAPGGVTLAVVTCRLTGTDALVARTESALRRLVCAT